MKFEPTIPHDPYYIYKWTFSDGTTYNTREVWKTSYAGLSGNLQIFYAGKPPLCCENKRYFYISRE